VIRHTWATTIDAKTVPVVMRYAFMRASVGERREMCSNPAAPGKSFGAGKQEGRDSGTAERRHCGTTALRNKGN